MKYSGKYGYHFEVKTVKQINKTKTLVGHFLCFETRVLGFIFQIFLLLVSLMELCYLQLTTDHASKSVTQTWNQKCLSVNQ